MSWSITFIGKSENVVKALEEQSTFLDGQTKVEYDSALPHMVGLVKENFGNGDQVMKITASGHGYAIDGEQRQRYCAVNVEPVYSIIV